MSQRWNDSAVEKAAKAVAKCQASDWPAGVVAAAAKAVGFDVTVASLEGAFKRAGKPTAFSMLRGAVPPRARSRWTDAVVERAKDLLGKSESLDESVEKMSEAFGFPVTVASLKDAFRQHGIRGLEQFLKRRAAGGDYSRLVEAVKKAPVSFAELCDKLDLSPGRTKALIERARSEGVRVHVEHDHVGLHVPADDRVVETKISPVVGQRQHLAHISDLHLGSKYCLRAQLKDFVHRAYDRGVREITCTGDNLDGQYRHGMYEVTHVGVEAQTRDLFETLPHLPGLHYHCITGNHDFTFTEASGVDTGHYITSYFRERGRDDITFYGDRGAYVRIRGIVIHLWHPGGGTSYAVSYKLQKKVEAYSSIKPQVLFAGHWHRYCHIYERGIHAIAAPCFQGGGSAFGKSLPSSAPAIGGLFYSFDVTRDGTIREFAIEKRSYFERERPIEIYNQLDAVEVGEDDQYYEAAPSKLRRNGRRARG